MCTFAEAELKGVPADVVTTAREKAKEADLAEGLCRLTLQGPCYSPVMQYAEHRPLREALYRDYVTRASSNLARPAPLAGSHRTSRAGDR